MNKQNRQKQENTIFDDRGQAKWLQTKELLLKCTHQKFSLPLNDQFKYTIHDAMT